MNEDSRGDAALRALSRPLHDTRVVPARLLPETDAGTGATAINEWLGTLRRSAWLIAGCVVVGVAAAVLVTRRITPLYEASAAMRIELQKASLPALEPLLVSSNDISTEMEVLHSETLAEAVVDSLRLQLALEAPAQLRRAQLFDTIRVSSSVREGSYRLLRDAAGRHRLIDRVSGAGVGVVPSTARVDVGGVSFTLTPRARALPTIDFSVRSRDAAAEELRGNLAIDRPVREANIVTIRYRTSDPEIARDVPNALATVLMAQRQSVRRTEGRGTQRFLREQLDRISAQLSVSEEDLRRFREREQVVDLEEQGRSESSQLVRAQTARSDLEIERAALAKLLSEVTSAARRPNAAGPSPYRNLIAFPSLVRNQAAWQLLNSLATVEDRRTELLARRSPQDPDVQLLTSRVHELEEQLRTFGTTYLQGLTDQATTLDATLASSADALQRFPARELALTRLQRQRKLLEDLYTLLQTRLKEAEIASAAGDASVRVIDLARLPRTPVAPKPALNVSLAALGGLLIGMSFAFARAHMDHSVHSRREVRAATGMPVLGLVPRATLEQRWSASVRRALGGTPLLRARAKRGTVDDARTRSSRAGAAPPHGTRTYVVSGASTAVTEAFSRLEANLRFARGHKVTVVLTSPMPGEGKTTVATNLALVASRHGRRVLLIDADMRRGDLSAAFQAARTPGLAEVLQGAVSFDLARRTVDVGGPGAFHYLTSGSLHSNPLHLLETRHMRELLATAAAEYDLVLIDTPPLNAVVDAVVLGAMSDGVLIVARAGHTTMDALLTGMEHLLEARAPIIGVVLNDVDLEQDASYDSEYRNFGRYAEYYDDLSESTSSPDRRAWRPRGTS